LYLGCEVPFVFLIFLLLLDFSVVSGEEKTEKTEKMSGEWWEKGHNVGYGLTYTPTLHSWRRNFLFPCALQVCKTCSPPCRGIVAE
jgi:hypothetical protein